MSVLTSKIRAIRNAQLLKDKELSSTLDFADAGTTLTTALLRRLPVHSILSNAAVNYLLLCRLGHGHGWIIGCRDDAAPTPFDGQMPRSTIAMPSIQTFAARSEVQFPFRES